MIIKNVNIIIWRSVIYIDTSIDWYDENHKPHRTDGPAEEFSDGGKRWWIHGQEALTE